MEPEKKSNGATVGLIIIVIILIIGGIYIWSSQVKTATEQNQDTGLNNSANVNNSDSAEIDSLGQEVDGTDTNAGVDANTIK